MTSVTTRRKVLRRSECRRRPRSARIRPSRRPSCSRICARNWRRARRDVLRKAYGHLLSIEPRRLFCRYAKGLLECHADPPDGALVEKTPDQRDAMRYAAGWVELRQGLRRIRRPIAARLGDLDKSRTQR